MDQSLEREIRRLYSCFHSPRDRHGRAFVPLADAYRRAGDLLRAKLLLEEGLRLHPDFASAHVVAVRVSRDVSDYKEALIAARRVLELDPGNVEVRQALADIGRLQEDSAPAVAPVQGEEGEAALPEESWMAGDAGVWGAGMDSGLASVDPAALAQEDEQARAQAEEDEQARPQAEKPGEAPSRDAASDGDEGQRAARPGAGEEAPHAQPHAASDSSGDTDIYTRTMGQLYEQQGLYAHAIAVYERLLESDPDDTALAGRLERLRQRSGEEPYAPVDLGGGAAATKEPTEPPPGEETGKEPASAPDPDPGLPVVPIEMLAPDPPMAGAPRETP